MERSQSFLSMILGKAEFSTMSAIRQGDESTLSSQQLNAFKTLRSTFVDQT